MSSPNFENIDRWLFDYSEGNLSIEQMEQLRLFVFLHPELDIELDTWQSAKVENEKVIYPHTSTLLQPAPSFAFPVSIALTAAALLILFLIPISDNSLTLIAEQGQQEDLQKIESLNQRLSELEQTIEDLNETNLRLSNQLAAAQGDKNRLTAQVRSANTLLAESEFMTVRSSNVEPSSMITEVDAQEFADEIADSDEQDGLETYPVETIEYTAQHGHDLSSPHAKSVSKSEFNKSFSARMKQYARALQRMMDNPIALKNSRDPHFLIPGAQVQDVNFSAVGTLLSTRAQALSRAQWLGSEQEQFVNKVAIDGYSYAMRGGLGAQLSHSSFHNGGIQQGEIALTYAPKISVNRHFSVEPSMRFKMGAKMLDYNRVNQLQEVEFTPGQAHGFYGEGQTPIGKQLWYKDLGAGLMVNTKWFFAGANVDNLFRHEDKMYTNDLNADRRSTMNVTLSAGTDWENTKKTMTLSPYVVYNSNEGQNKVWAGANYRAGWFMLGASVSSAKEPMASVGMKLKYFSLHLMSDYSRSETLNKYVLSHQVSLRINGKMSRFGKRLTNL